MTQKIKEQQLLKEVASINTFVLSFVFAILSGIGLFVMTVWLLLKGGDQIGPHLELLGQFFIGYSVTWTGSLAGLFYGALFGWIIGWLIASLYNRIVNL